MEASHFAPHGVSLSSSHDNEVKFTGITSATSGTIVLKPIEAKFVGLDPHVRVDPYCKFKIGLHRGKSPSAITPDYLQFTWTGDGVSIHRHHQEMFAKLKVKNKNIRTFRETLGKAKIPLDDVIAKGKVQWWVNIYSKGIITGEVLMGVEFHPKI